MPLSTQMQPTVKAVCNAVEHSRWGDAMTSRLQGLRTRSTAGQFAHDKLPEAGNLASMSEFSFFRQAWERADDGGWCCGKRNFVAG